MQWFGNPWPSEAERAPVCEHDELRTDVPVGATCGMCPNPIEPEQRGVWIEHMHGSGVSEVRPVHINCLLHGVFPDAIIPPK